MISHVLQLNKSIASMSGWAGFMKNSFPAEGRVPELVILPFALGKPSDENTIFSCLKYAREHSRSESFFVTFDQPLYRKAIDILFSFPQLLPKGLIKLGEFHMIMSYLVCIGNIMADTGLDVLWSSVYAKDSVVHMMNGHAYSQSLVAHLTTSAALLCMLLKIEENSSYLSSIEQIVIDLQKEDITE